MELIYHKFKKRIEIFFIGGILITVLGLSTVAFAETSAPVVNSVVRNGDTYTISLTAPSDSGDTTVKIYSSLNPDFNSSDTKTEVGSVNLEPGQTVVLTYTAKDSRPRYAAIQAYNSSNEGSALIGQNNQVIKNSEESSPGTSGTVNAPGSSKDINTNAAEVLSDSSSKNESEDNASASDSVTAWTIIIILILASIAYINRERLLDSYHRYLVGSSSKK